jgi:hypothetical protein
MRIVINAKHKRHKKRGINDMTSKMKSKKCRFCKNDEIEIKPSEVMMGFYVQCVKCEYGTCSCKTKEEAIEDWKERN